MEEAGYTVVDPLSIIFTHLDHVIHNYILNIIGIKEIQDDLDKLSDALKK